MEASSMAYRSDLICGCRLCGCLCADHSPDRVEQLCAPHADRAVFRVIAHEAGTLVSLALFVSMVMIWTAIWSS
jgi:hypothetical protein